MSNNNSFTPTAPVVEALTENISEAWNSTFTDENVDNTDSYGEWSALNSSIGTTSISSPLTPTTTYSYAGSALGSESTSYLNEKQNGANKISLIPTASDAVGDKGEEGKRDDSMFECNICLDIAKDAVVSMCGHLFCWPCLHQWLETRPHRKLCPVCKAAIGKDKVIPLYGRNSTKKEDPRNKVPPRPAGQRIEPEPQHSFAGFNFGDGFHMSFGIGAFPFGYFASSFNFGEPRPTPANRGTTQYEDEQQLSKLFLYLAFLCIAWLLFA